MIETIRHIKRLVIPGWFAIVFLLIPAGKGYALEKIFTIGVLNSVTVLNPVLEGFKEGMAELGYIEGKDVRYVYNGIIGGDEEEINAEIKRLLSQKIDILLSVGNETITVVRKAFQGTDMPILASACLKPVEAGLINSMTNPGGNITGVAVADSAPKTLEWLKEIVPGIKKVYLPYNPDENASRLNLIGLDEAASRLGIELVHHKVHSVEEAVRAIEALPDDVKAVFRIPSPTLDARSSELTQAAIKRGIPTVARVPVDEDVLLTFSTDLKELGKKTAWLAYQVRQGINPSDLPVETSDVFLTINLKTAERLGIRVPDSILFQAKNIIR